MNSSCIFCKIISGEIPSEKVYEDDKVLAFKDISPKRAVHVLIIPKKHLDSINCVCAENIEYVSAVMEAIPKIASLLPLENGYRIVTNCGKDAMQSVKHLHFHLLGGEPLGEGL